MKTNIAAKKQKNPKQTNSIWLIVFIDSHVVITVFYIFNYVVSGFSASSTLLEWSLDKPLNNWRDNREAHDIVLGKEKYTRLLIFAIISLCLLFT